jgi:CRP/FNR family cyclic AMP-dependent transcriptional regulator
VLKVLEEQGLLTAHGKTIVVFGARPRVRPRPASMALKAGTPAG